MNIRTNNVTSSTIISLSGLSVVGRASNTAGVSADIVGTAGQVLRVSGTTLGFGTIDPTLAFGAGSGSIVLSTASGDITLTTTGGGRVSVSDGISFPAAGVIEALGGALDFGATAAINLSAGGNGNVNITSSGIGGVVLKPGSDSSAAILVYKANGTTPCMLINTSSNRVAFGDSAGGVIGNTKGYAFFVEGTPTYPLVVEHAAAGISRVTFCNSTDPGTTSATVAFESQLCDDGGTPRAANRITNAWTDATAAGFTSSMAFSTCVATSFAERGRISGTNFCWNVTTAGASMVGGMSIKNGTAPTGNVTDAFQHYAADQAAGNSAPHWRTENGSVVKLYKASTFTQTYSTATATHSNPTATALTDNSAGTANTTIQAMANPTDTPATADALRDDIVANLLPAIRNNVADLAAAINALIVDVANVKGVVNTLIDDHQLLGVAG